jgi:hypothetical protein
MSIACNPESHQRRTTPAAPTNSQRQICKRIGKLGERDSKMLQQQNCAVILNRQLRKKNRQFFWEKRERKGFHRVMHVSTNYIFLLSLLSMFFIFQLPFFFPIFADFLQEGEKVFFLLFHMFVLSFFSLRFPGYTFAPKLTLSYNGESMLD